MLNFSVGGIPPVPSLSSRIFSSKGQARKLVLLSGKIGQSRGMARALKVGASMKLFWPCSFFL